MVVLGNYRDSTNVFVWGWVLLIIGLIIVVLEIDWLQDIGGLIFFIGGLMVLIGGLLSVVYFSEGLQL